MSEVKRPGPGDLEFRAPDCPVCDREVDHDGDGWNCETCGASWSNNGSGGQWLDDEYYEVADRQCRSILHPWPLHQRLADQTYPCIRPERHLDDPEQAEHYSPGVTLTWKDSDHRQSQRALSADRRRLHLEARRRLHEMKAREQQQRWAEATAARKAATS